jgi:hypothetical protein
MGNDTTQDKDKKTTDIDDIVKQLESLQGTFIKKMDALQKEVEESKGKVISKLSKIRDDAK